MSSNDDIFKFPCEFSFKIFGRPTDEFKNAVTNIMHEHFVEFDPSRDSLATYSSEKNYCAYTVTIKAESREQLDNCYRALSDEAAVVMVL